MDGDASWHYGIFVWDCSSLFISAAVSRDGGLPCGCGHPDRMRPNSFSSLARLGGRSSSGGVPLYARGCALAYQVLPAMALAVSGWSGSHAAMAVLPCSSLLYSGRMWPPLSVAPHAEAEDVGALPIPHRRMWSLDRRSRRL